MKVFKSAVAVTLALLSVIVPVYLGYWYLPEPWSHLCAIAMGVGVFALLVACWVYMGEEPERGS